MKNEYTYIASISLAVFVTAYIFSNDKYEHNDVSVNQEVLANISNEIRLLNENILHLGNQIESLAISNAGSGLYNAEAYEKNNNANLIPANDEQAYKEEPTEIDKQAELEKFNMIKSNVLVSLDNPATTLPDILNSTEMKELSDEQRDEVMEEVVYRFNNGYIEKEKFLPGYKE